MLITKHRPDDETVNWLEDDIQAYIVQQLRRSGYVSESDANLSDSPVGLFACSLEGIKLTKGQANKAKLLGLEAGEPDIRVWLPNLRVLLIELKRRQGVLTDSQKKRHPIMKKLGFEVHVVKKATPYEAWLEVMELLEVEKRP